MKGPSAGHKLSNNSVIVFPLTVKRCGCDWARGWCIGRYRRLLLLLAGVSISRKIIEESCACAILNAVTFGAVAAISSKA